MYFACFLLVVLLASVKVKCIYENNSSAADWDMIIFTQSWPMTTCYVWQEKDAKNTCTFPTLTDIWTIHGLWPEKAGTEGPSFCNKSLHFDLGKLDSFRPQLELYWMNIEKNTPTADLWKHEWLKHGTCAVTLPVLDNEVKYFKQGLDWIGKFNMKHVLAKSGIVPHPAAGYEPGQLLAAVHAVTGHEARLQCYQAKSGLSYIHELRICFDRALRLMDCDGRRHGGLNTNCDLNRPVIYTNVLPQPATPRPPAYPWQVNAYRFIQFLIWFTL